LTGGLNGLHVVQVLQAAQTSLESGGVQVSIVDSGSIGRDAASVY
jgi:hypothetical protein